MIIVATRSVAITIVGFIWFIMNVNKFFSSRYVHFCLFRFIFGAASVDIFQTKIWVEFGNLSERCAQTTGKIDALLRSFSFGSRKYFQQ